MLSVYDTKLKDLIQFPSWWNEWTYYFNCLHIRFNLIPSPNLEKKSSKVFDMTGFDPQISELTENGAWCWFADPRAIYFKGTDQVSFSCQGIKMSLLNFHTHGIYDSQNQCYPGTSYIHTA